jgi:glycosyltransferase involved in cell wall biosynthesis
MMPTPTVLHVLEALGGGTAKHLIDVVTHTTAVRHEVAVPRRRVRWLSDDQAVDSLAAAGAVVHIVEMRREPAHPFNLGAMAQVRRLIHSRRPDIVHAHSSVGGAVGRIAATGTGAARMYTANGVATGRVSLTLERVLARLTDHTVAVSESEGQRMLELGLAQPATLTVIPNGIDLARPAHRTMRLRDDFGIPHGVPLVGGLARLVPQKSPEIFVRACALVARRHPDAHFLLIGSGVLEKRVRAEIQRLGLAARFHLHPEFDSPSSVLDELDVFLSTSRFEGGPYAPLEAMRAGVPVVLTDVVGNRDVVEHGVTGFLAPIDDVDGLAEWVDRLVADSRLKKSVTEAATKRLTARFDARAMGAALGDLYLRVGARPGDASARR